MVASASRTRRRWAAHQARARNQSKEQAARLLNQSANCETSDVREYLHAGADGALDKGVSAALQTDVLARVYHDRFPDRCAGASSKRARRE